MKRVDHAADIAQLLADMAVLSPKSVESFEVELRKRFGGRAVTIERRAPVTIEQIDAALRERKSVRTIASEAGISRSTIYRMISSKSLKRNCSETV